MAAGDFCTVALVKSLLNITVAGDDAILAVAVTAATVRIQTYCSRAFTSASYTQVLNGTGNGSLLLMETPVTAVASVGLITRTSAGTTTQTLAANTEYIFTRFGIRAIGGIFPRGVGNVTVTYTAGYATLPYDLTECCAKLAAYMYREYSRVGQSSKVMGGETVFFQTTAFPADVKTTLQQYMRRMPLGA